MSQFLLNLARRSVSKVDLPQARPYLPPIFMAPVTASLPTASSVAPAINPPTAPADTAMGSDSLSAAPIMLASPFPAAPMPLVTPVAPPDPVSTTVEVPAAHVENARTRLRAGEEHGARALAQPADAVLHARADTFEQPRTPALSPMQAAPPPPVSSPPLQAPRDRAPLATGDATLEPLQASPAAVPAVSPAAPHVPSVIVSGVGGEHGHLAWPAPSIAEADALYRSEAQPPVNPAPVADVRPAAPLRNSSPLPATLPATSPHIRRVAPTESTALLEEPSHAVQHAISPPVAQHGLQVQPVIKERPLPPAVLVRPLAAPVPP
ncbi:MAG: hypothetical protein EOM24_04060, partial [Chloroflexia bacterium]|nr:hypothetical protein [Chloroflexia bacterium]